ncbi:MAG: DNA-binding protein [Thaumarchaeota archaeon]|nr:DNA-binding protein [Nitrososphaerota archaeon]MCL5066937.1 DNA-binding protein [Nitrososphaerota archaeon]MDG6906592.1 DNA-binding protein [Nitrososphaerota archaeon]
MSEDQNQRISDKQSQFEQEKQAKLAREQMLRMVFTSDARERLNNIRMVKPDLATSVENQIFQLASSGRLRHQVSDEELKQMLGQLQQPKREFKINWK